MAPRTAPTRAALSTQRVLEAAVAFADEHGVEALTMRRIADELGCGVMSLYNHVANKDEMLAGMVDLVAAEIEPPVIDGHWRAALRASATTAHDVLLAHPWAPAEWSLRMPGPARIGYMESILEVLTDAGLRPELVYHGYHAVTMHIVGFTLQQIGYQRGLTGDLADIAGEFMAGLGDDYPFMADHVRAHLADEPGTGGHDDEFMIVLDFILDGLERADGRA